MKRLIMLFLTALAAMSLLSATIVFAGPGNNGRGNAYGHQKRYEKMLKNFSKIESKRLKWNGGDIDWDEPDSVPIIKNGRTLIPVRAIVRAMGGLVNWYANDEIAAIISPNRDQMLYFFLDDEDEGLILLFQWTGEGNEDNIWDEDNWDDGEEVGPLDVDHGLYNNRTYVPLRFIAETFGINVGYDDKSGEIHLSNGPNLLPKKVTFYDSEDLGDIDVGIILNGFAFEGIVGLDEDDEYEVTSSGSLEVSVGGEDYDVDLIVTLLLDGYLEDIDEAETELEFLFEDGDEDEEKEFTIKLKYLDDEDEKEEESELTDDDVDFKNDDIEIEVMNLGDYEVEEIILYDPDDDSLEDPEAPGDYEVQDDTLVIFENDYLDDLEDALDALGEDEAKFRIVFDHATEPDVVEKLEIQF